MYEWRFVHIAKRFGIIRGPWEAGKIAPRRIARAYEGTIVADATLNELIHDKMDIERTIEIIEKIQTQEMEIITEEKRTVEDISPLANLGNLTELYLEFYFIEDVSPLAGLTDLEILSLRYNKITDTSPLTGLKTLTNLRLENNPITNL